MGDKLKLAKEFNVNEILVCAFLEEVDKVCSLY